MGNTTLSHWGLSCSIHASAWVNIVSESKRRARGGSDGLSRVLWFSTGLTFSVVIYLAFWNDVQKKGDVGAKASLAGLPALLTGLGRRLFGVFAMNALTVASRGDS
jgi:hypothetical protein